MMEQVRQSVPSSMIPNEELEGWILLMGTSNKYSQLKQTYMSDPSKVPKTMADMLKQITLHIPLATVPLSNKNSSAFGTTGNPTKGNPNGSKNNNSNNDGGKDKGKQPSRDCDHCTKYHPDYPNKRHWKNACPNIQNLILERHGHNVQQSSSSNSNGSNDSNIQSPPQQSQQSGNQQLRTNVSIGLGLNQGRSNTSGGGRTPSGNFTASTNAIIASINYSGGMSMLESYNNRTDTHKHSQILDPQSQVAIFNREELVSNIRDSSVTLTLHGMGNGSLLVTQIADHPVLGDVWFHPDAAINVWQMRATEFACNVELIKEFDTDLGCKVTTAFLATDRNSGAQYRFKYVNNLYVLEEGRQ